MLHCWSFSHHSPNQGDPTFTNNNLLIHLSLFAHLGIVNNGKTG